MVVKAALRRQQSTVVCHAASATQRALLCQGSRFAFLDPALAHRGMLTPDKCLSQSELHFEAPDLVEQSIRAAVSGQALGAAFTLKQSLGLVLDFLLILGGFTCAGCTPCG